MTHSTSIIGSSYTRGRRGFSQLWQVPTFLIGLLAFIGVAGSTPWRHTPQEREFDSLVTTLRQSLEADDAANIIVAHAENVQLRVNGFPSRAGEAHFLIGSAYYRQAQNMPPAYAKEVWPRALEHLEKAESLSVADRDRPALQYRLGFTLYQQNTDVPRALDLMTLAVEKGADQPLQGYQTLIQAHLKRTPANLDSALSASRRILDLTPEREVEAVALAHLQHAELLMRKELRSDAIKELERVSSNASPAVRVKARLLQARCSEEDGNWGKAIPIWQELLADATHVEGGKGRISYQLGWCYQQMEPADTVETLRVWSDALKAGGLEGQAGRRTLRLLVFPAGIDPLAPDAQWDRIKGQARAMERGYVVR